MSSPAPGTDGNPTSTAPDPLPLDLVQAHPAKRVVQLLDAFLAAGRRASPQTAKAVWADVLRVDIQSSVGSLYPALSDVIALMADVRVLIASSPVASPDDVLPLLEPFESILNNGNLDSPFEQWEKMLSERVLLGLRMAATALSHSAPISGVAREDLQALERAVADLEALVAGTPQVDQRVAQALAACLHAMQYALSRYRVAGAEAFLDAWKVCVGELVRTASPKRGGGMQIVPPSLRTALGALTKVAKAADSAITTVARLSKAYGDITDTLSGIIDSGSTSL